MFNKYQSHSLTDLARELAEITVLETPNPMRPSWVVVQNNEVKEWLSLQIADLNGIAGNFKFIFPSEFIWMIYRLKEPDVPKTLPTDLNSLHWILFELLGKDPDFIKQIPFISDTELSITKRFQLAGQIADVFDQYQVYRPEMINNWKKRKFSTKNADEQWQLQLWIRLQAYWSANPITTQIPGRSDAYKKVIEWLNNDDLDIVKGLPGEIFIFGLSHLNKPFMEVISGISKHKEVHFFGRDIEINAPNHECRTLFDSWKNPNCSQLKFLNQFLIQNDQKIKNSKVGIQSEKLSSIEIHSCHGVRREVEVVKDEILRFLDKNLEADTSDILILLPDADEYAPLLETHFNDKSNSQKLRLPLSKLYRNQSKTLEYTLVYLLDLFNTSFKPSMVVDLLSLDPVKKRFGLTDDDIDLIENWILTNRIYRGMGEYFNDTFSWQKGINQLMAGAVLEPDYMESFSGLVPLVELSTSDEMALMSKFSLFINTLKSLTEEFEHDKTPGQWLDLVNRMCKDIIVDVENGNDDASIFNIISRLKDQLKYTLGEELVPFPLFSNWLKGQFDTASSSSGRFGQGITVSTYIPYRSVPFKFIAMLGLNEGVFPRKAVRPEFDLIYKDPKVGDRIQSEDDSYLFLEVLSSASKHLHISYKGQDLRSETDRLPSMLVQQLKESFPENKILLKRHRLHPFNEAYFRKYKSASPQQPDMSYDLKHCNVANQINYPEKKVIDFNLNSVDSFDIFKQSDISIYDLIKFVTEPANLLLSNEFNVNINLYNNDIQDREIFDLTGLDKYKLNALLYDSIQKGISEKRIFNYARTAGYLPDMLKGKQVFQEEYNKTEKLRQEIESLSELEEKSHEIRINHKGVQLYGSVRGIHGKSLVLHRVGQRRESHEIEQWVLHNALIASGFPIENSFYISFDKGGAVEVNKIHTDSINGNVLDLLLNWFLDDIPVFDKINFFPKTSKTFVKTWLNSEDEDAALNKAMKVFTPGRFNKFAEGGEESNRIIWRGQDPFSRSSFKDNALRFWTPVLKAVEESNE